MSEARNLLPSELDAFVARQDKHVQETLRREVLEESGWALKDVRLLGFIHFHHLADKPEGYRYPYPDFVQFVYTGQAGEYRSEAREVGEYEVHAGFQPLEQVQSLSLSISQRMFLGRGVAAALAVRLSPALVGNAIRKSRPPDESPLKTGERVYATK